MSAAAAVPPARIHMLHTRDAIGSTRVATSVRVRTAAENVHHVIRPDAESKPELLARIWHDMRVDIRYMASQLVFP